MDPSQCHPPWPSNRAKVVKGLDQLALTCRIIAHRCRAVVATMSWGRGNRLLLWGRTIRIRHLRAQHPVQAGNRLVNQEPRNWILLLSRDSSHTESLPLSSSSLMETSLSLSLRLLRFAIVIYLSWVATSRFASWLWTNFDIAKLIQLKTSNLIDWRWGRADAVSYQMNW